MLFHAAVAIILTEENIITVCLKEAPGAGLQRKPVMNFSTKMKNRMTCSFVPQRHAVLSISRGGKASSRVENELHFR